MQIYIGATYANPRKSKKESIALLWIFGFKSGRFKKMNEMNNKVKVAVAVSGGVDSAVAAGLLENGGFEVAGIFGRFLDDKCVLESNFNTNFNTKKEDEKRAKAVCEKLGIPFRAVDLRAEFKKRIVEKFIADTKKGLTPNPCVLCNEEIKFGLLMDAALKSGADFFATGHYCQTKIDKNGIYHLLKGKDKEKDQSYFLWRLKQKQFKKIIFPLGVFEKSETRDLAKAWGLAIKDNSESQDVCFISGPAAEFLQRHLGKNLGDIVDTETQKIIGRHDGLWFYTIGQRKGIGLAGGPFYVAGKNFAKNELAVSKKMPAAKIVKLRSVNWIAGGVPNLPIKVKAKIRYRSKDAPAILDKSGKNYSLQFAKPQFAATPGQSAVFYQKRELLGGGIIKA